MTSVSAGSTSENQEDVEIRVERVASGERSRIFAGERPLAKAKFIASDLSSEDGFEVHADYVDVDADGEFPSEWLIEGHRYRFIVRGEDVPRGYATGFVRWHGQPVIDVLKLSMRSDQE